MSISSNIVSEGLKDFKFGAVVVLVLCTAAYVYLDITGRREQKKSEQEEGIYPPILDKHKIDGEIANIELKLEGETPPTYRPFRAIRRQGLLRRLQQLRSESTVLRKQIEGFGGDQTFKIQDFLRDAEWDIRPGEMVRLGERKAEFVIGKNSPFPKSNRIVVHYVNDNAGLSDISALKGRIEEEKAGKGWLIAERFPENRKESGASFGMEDADKKIAVFRPNELLFKKLFPTEKYFGWLRKSAKELYLDKRNVLIEGGMLDEGPKFLVDDHIDEWKNSSRVKNHMAILADFGSGKSWFCWHYALRQLEIYEKNPENERIPLLIHLGSYKGIAEPKELIEAFFNSFNKAAGFEVGPGNALNYKLFDTLNKDGKFLIILDGLDEMMTRDLDLQQTVEKLLQLATPASKIILTSRRTLFKDRTERQYQLGRHNNFEVIYLDAFDKAKIKQFIIKRFPGNWKKYWDRISERPEMKRLFELAKRPIMLNIILEVIDDPPSGGAITILTLYESYTDKLLERVSRKGPLLDVINRRELMQRLAWKIYENYKETEEISQGELTKLLDHSSEENLINDLVRSGQKGDGHSDERDLRTNSFLVRNGAGGYFFAHRSFLEYFVARKLGSDLKEGRKEPFTEHRLSSEIVDFLQHLEPDSKLLYEWIDNSRMNGNGIPPGEGFFHGNLITLMNKVHLVVGDDDATSLKGRNFSRLHVFEADLTDANLEGCNFAGSILEGGSLGGSRLVNTDFTGATLQGLNLGVRSAAKGVKFSPDGKYIASGDDKNNLILFRKEGNKWSDKHTEKAGHKDSITNVAFSSDGNFIASSSFDRTVRVWGLREKIGIDIPEHGDTVYDLEFLPVTEKTGENNEEPVDRYVFTASNCLVKIWRLRKTKKDAFLADEMFSGNKHKKIVYKLAISRNGEFLVSAGFDHKIGLWKVQRSEDRIGLVLRDFSGRA